MKLPSGNDNVILETFDEQNLGFLRITADQRQLHIDYQPLSSNSPSDLVTVELKTRQLVH
jgi:hypothetical protein